MQTIIKDGQLYYRAENKEEAEELYRFKLEKRASKMSNKELIDELIHRVIRANQELECTTLYREILRRMG